MQKASLLAFIDGYRLVQFDWFSLNGAV